MKWSWSCVLAAALVSGRAAAAPVELYVSPAGNDAATGRSANQAFATPARAVGELRKVRGAGGLPDGAVVRLLAGTYYVDEPLALGPDESGSKNAPVIMEGEGPGKTILCGGRALPQGRVAGRVMEWDLGQLGLADRPPSLLLFRGEPQTLARYPNVDPSDPHGGTWACVAEVRGDSNQRDFHYGEDEEHRWAHPEDGEVAIFSGYDWAFSIVSIARHLPDERKIALANDTWCPMRIGDRYIVMGLPEELDAPGEWVVDRERGVLRFYLPDDPAEGDIVVATTGNVVRIVGAHDVELRGMTIEGGNGEGVVIESSDRCVVAGCAVRGCGGWGVSVSGGHASGARGNDVSLCGHGGISVSGGNADTLEPGGNFADNNYVHHCARVWRTYRPGVSVSGVGNTVSHNLINDMPHAGMLLGGNGNIVEYNVVHHVNLESADTGGIYFCSRDWTQRGNEIRYNVFHHVGGFGKRNSWAPVSAGKVEYVYPGFTWGIYLDDPTSGTRVFGNILYDVPICGLHNHGGRDNTFENNIIVDTVGLQAGMLDPNWSEWPAIYERLRARRGEGSPYLLKYPEIAGIADDHPEAMTGVRFVRNIVYYTTAGTQWLRQQRSWADKQQLYQMWVRQEDLDANEFDYNCVYADPGLKLSVSLGLAGQSGKDLSWDEWRALGKDEHSVLADPLFVDAVAHDFGLKPESPALALGFQQIPVGRIGPYESPDRATWPIVEAPGVSALGDFHTVRFHEPPQFRRLPVRDVSVRDGIGNTLAKAAAGETIRVAYFGGGIHPSDGWRAQVTEWLRKHVGPVEEIDASVCDCVRGSAFSAYRFGHDVLARRPHLVLVDFASDDKDTDPGTVAKVIEGVVRQARRADPELDVVFLYAFREGYEADYAEGLFPSAISAYERVADRYGAPTVNMASKVLESYRAGDLVIKGEAPEGKESFSADGVRPSETGNRLYAEAAISGLEELLGGARRNAHGLPSPISEDNWENAKTVPVTRDMLEGEWTALDASGPLMERFSRFMDTIWVTRTPGAKLTFSFRGTAVSILDLMGPDTGCARVTLDGRDLGARIQVDQWCTFQRHAALNIADGLPDEVHTVTVELMPDAPDRSAPIAAAKEQGSYRAQDFEGVAFRFGGIRVMGEVRPIGSGRAD